MLREATFEDLKMTKQEVREDYSDAHGNPFIKQASRRVHREILRGSIAQVKSADVLVANPTHLAVALKYEAEEMNAPQVVAKGADLVAAQLRKAAEEANVPIIRTNSCSSLFEVEVDEEIHERSMKQSPKFCVGYQVSSKAS